MFGVRLLLLLSLCGVLYATTTPSTTVPPTTTFVVSTGEGTVEEGPAEEAGPPKARKKPYSYSLKVNSTILSRYSTTVVRSRTVNPEDIAQEATFLVTLPDSAFISNFSIDSNNFAVSVNIGPNEKIDFKLTYEELLQRRRGFYEQQINISPGQVVEELTVDVYITENNNISMVNVPDIRNDVEIKLDEKENPLATIDYLSGNQVHISYHPTKRQQLDASESGIFGQFVVEYDVQRGGQDDAGELQLVDGYFVHFFAPETINPIKKHVVFVIDTSGSMSGRKIVQTKEALNSILSDLRPDDLFSLVEFNGGIRVWNGESAVDTSYTEPYHYPPSIRPPFPPGLPSPPVPPPRPFPGTYPYLPSPSYLPSPPAPPSFPSSSPFPPSPASPPGLPPGLSSPPASPANRPPAVPPSLFPPASSQSSSNTVSPSSPTGPPSSSLSGTSSSSTPSSSSSTPQGSSVSSTTTSKPETTTEFFVPRNPIQATPENVRLAKNFVDSLVASGGTNINDALLEALKHAEESANKVDMVPLIVFLTDGEPTVGESSPDAIIKNIKQANSELDVPTYSLAFGTGADFNFLKKLSLQNSGFARRIYEASDASLQLQEFFEEILTPLLSNIKITYLEDNVANGTVSKSVFRSYFKGSELVLTGRLSSPDVTDFRLKVEGTSPQGPFELTCFPFPRHPDLFPPIFDRPIDPEPRTPRGPYSNFLERLWAYRTIRDLLDQLVEKDDEAEKEKIKKEALDISLQYNFVTEVTSLVVVKPNSTEEGKITDSNSPSAESVASFGGFGAQGPGGAQTFLLALPAPPAPPSIHLQGGPPRQRPAIRPTFRPLATYLPKYTNRITTTTRGSSTTTPVGSSSSQGHFSMRIAAPQHLKLSAPIYKTQGASYYYYYDDDMDYYSDQNDSLSGVGLLSTRRSHRFGPRGFLRRTMHRSSIRGSVAHGVPFMLPSSSRHAPAALMPPPLPPPPVPYLRNNLRGSAYSGISNISPHIRYTSLALPATTTLTPPPLLSWDNITVHDNGTAVFLNGTEIELGFEESALAVWDDCTTTTNVNGTCRYIQFCTRPEYTTSFDNFMEQSCMVLSEFGDIFFGVCCPEDPATVNITQPPTANNTSFTP